MTSGSPTASPERIVFCAILGVVALREVSGAMGRFKRSRPDERPRPVMLLFPLVPILLVYQAFHVPLTVRWVTVGCIGLLASLALFEWAMRATGREFFSWALSEDIPQFLCEKGPYAYVRNPFYTSYLLTYLSAAAALQTVTSILIFVGGSFTFWQVARFEERKFAHSPLAARYVEYLRRTGRFLPRLRRIFGSAC